MRELNFVDRCVLFVILVVSTITMAGGVLVILTEGYTEKALVLLVCGGTTSIFTCSGILTSAILGRRYPPQDANVESSPELFDPPPEYRFTWREEYLKKSPDSLREELESQAPSEAERPRSKSTKKDVRETFHVRTAEIGIHRGRNSGGDQPGTSSSAPLPERGRAATVGGEVEARSGGRAAPIRATISVVTISGEANGGFADDEGLPSYEEVQRW